MLRGELISRRERRLLVRAVSDIFRLVPLSLFIIVPFMEFALPFVLKIFPDMLPSTFHSSFKKEEQIKNELKSRIALTGFFQDTLMELSAKRDKKAPTLKEVAEFIDMAKQGKHIETESVLRIASNFKDELTLDNMSRPQLVNMCRYMAIPPFGSDSFLRF
jgi:LETM1 and EF-hand domain-containing protein 1